MRVNSRSGEAFVDYRAGTVVRARQHVGIDAQSEGGILVPQVLGEFLDRDTSGKHDAGVVVAELMDAFPAGGDVAAPAA